MSAIDPAVDPADRAVDSADSAEVAVDPDPAVEPSRQPRPARPSAGDPPPRVGDRVGDKLRDRLGDELSDGDTPPQERWRPPLFWRFVQAVATVVLPLICRLRVSGDVPDAYRNGPLILAGNHIATFDPICFTAASRRRRLAPRMMATGGLFRAPIIGRLMSAAGHIRVDRGQESVANAVPDAIAALRIGSVVFIYPEGRIGLDPAMWPERAKTGLARLALATRVPVVPVATWGSHEVIAYNGRVAMIATLISAVWRRPVVRVHFGPPVDLSDLRAGAVGHAQRGSDRIMQAITDALAVVRVDEPRLPRRPDPTRPVSTARARSPQRPDVRRIS